MDYIAVPTNPTKPPSGIFNIGKIQVRGSAVLLIAAGFTCTVGIFLALLDENIVLAVGFCWVPFVVSILFYLRFIHGRPVYYFEYWLVDKFSPSLKRKVSKDVQTVV